jgi:hypothetical protein
MYAYTYAVLHQHLEAIYVWFTSELGESRHFSNGVIFAILLFSVYFYKERQQQGFHDTISSS